MSRRGDLDTALAGHGLLILGVFAPVSGDAVPARADSLPVRRVALAGNAGSALWPQFAASPEYRDGAPDPLDRWSRRVLDAIASGIGGETVYPFEGPPYFPFLRWLEKCAPVSASPLGPFAHETYGPWFALRSAIVFADDDLDVTRPEAGPCPACAEKPCIDACPAGAIARDKAYEPDECRAFLVERPESPCMSGGCRVRHACPVGRDFVLEPRQAALHMRAFRG